jgi:DNA processing protein
MLSQLGERKMGEKGRYWVGFNHVVGIGPARLRKLIDAFGDIQIAWHASGDELRLAGLGPTYIEALIKTRDKLDLDREMQRIDRLGFKITTWQDEDYPARLREIASPPPMLYVWGDLETHDRWAVAVVGTRRATNYGKAVTQEFAAVLAASGITIVSGLARGIDSIAHQAALDAGGRTLAVLGSGLDQIYPPEHRHLAEAIAGRGAILSDYPLGTKPEAKNFPPRNRIISGLSMAVAVVEAGKSSGALITADFAAEQGRDVFAVPGDLNKLNSMGTNRLIQSGALMLISPDEMLEALNLEMVARKEVAAEILPEDETERVIYEALSANPVHVDELQANCGLPIAQITATLAMLELKGRARQVGGMHYVRARDKTVQYIVD